MQPGFLLDPKVAYLNHGSFGACSQTVFDEYQHLQRELEREPTDFFTRQGGADGARLDEARSTLAAFVGAEAKDLVFVPNATSVLNAVIRSLALDAEDEVLTTAHEYGAITRTWNFVEANTVVCEPDEIARRIGSSTRAIFVSHITSPTSVVVPVEEICTSARAAADVLSIVDGAHVPGHVALDLGSLGADIYAGNCHKRDWAPHPPGGERWWGVRIGGTGRSAPTTTSLRRVCLFPAGAQPFSSSCH